MRPDKWRSRADRLLSLAKRAREAGDLKWAKHLTARAEQYFNKANALETTIPLDENGDSRIADTDKVVES